LSYLLANEKNTLLIKSRFFANRTFAAIGGEHRFKKGIISASIWPTLEALELGFKNKKMSINMGIDDINISDAHTFWLSFGVNTQ